MANAILKTSKVSELIKLSSAEIKILLVLCDLVKNNHIQMNTCAYDKIQNGTNLGKKTIQNNLSKLVANGMLVKAGTLQDYVINPVVFIVGNTTKCMSLYKAAVESESVFRQTANQQARSARGDFEARIFEASIEERRLNGGISRRTEDDL